MKQLDIAKDCNKIAVIGFGFCAKILISHLIAKDKKSKFLIFDYKKENLQNHAFANFSPHYILNVSANNMSAFSNNKYDFCNFLQKNYPQILNKIGESGHAPRHIYGEYIEEISSKYLNNNQQISFIQKEVVTITTNSEANFFITTKDNEKFEANKVVIATSFKQKTLPFSTPKSGKIINKLWNDSLNFHQNPLDNNSTCLIVGAGLSAVDVIVGLKNKNFTGKIFVNSRRGNFPKPHISEEFEKPDFIKATDAKNGILFLCLKIRKFLKENKEFDLRHVVDSIRNITQELWHNLDNDNKKKLLRLLPYWNIFRHRAPAQSIEIIEQMIKNKQLEIIKGKIESVEEKNGKIIANFDNKKVTTDYLVNCLGFEFNPNKYNLFKQMIDEKLLAPDIMMVKSANKNIHLLGGLNIGKHFEITSVPSLRVDVENLAQHLQQINNS